MAGDFFWEFAGGSITLIHEQGREAFGTYEQSPLGWRWISKRGKNAPSQLRIVCTWWQLKFFDEAGQHVGTMRRRFYPGLRPEWLQRDYLDWCQ